MSEDMKSKVRLRFGGGEEFEAEGSQEFIEKQKNIPEEYIYYHIKCPWLQIKVLKVFFNLELLLVPIS